MHSRPCRAPAAALLLFASLASAEAPPAMDADFARAVREWTTRPEFLTPLVDHLPKGGTVPSPHDVLGYHVGQPKTLTHTSDLYRYYRALAAKSPRVKVLEIGSTDEGRECLVVFVSSEANIRALDAHRGQLARLADPRGLSEAEASRILDSARPIYHLMGGLHSDETGPPEMLMELAYRLASEESSLVRKIRENVIVSLTPAAEPDGRDRYVDWYYRHRVDETDERENSGGPPYWGKYVFHDNNRDINYSQVTMRNLLQWYLKWHPPIMHDLHEAQALMYTYSGAAPQNPNLDPILFAELPWFSNFELAQMTKWGMPGVYTHAFMDGWSPGYLGSVSYNHNGMMRMYETQSGRETGAGAAGRGGGRGRGGDTPPQGDALAGRGDGGRGRATGPPTGRGGGQPREWYRGLPIPPGAAASFSRRNNTNYMETGVLTALQLTASFPNLIIENFYQKTKNSIESGKKDAPYGFVIPVQRDMTKAAELVNILRLQRIEVGQATAEIKTSDGTFPAGSYVIKRDQPYGRLAKNLLEKQSYPDPELRTYDDSGWTMGLAMLVEVKEIKDKAILDVPARPVERVTLRGKVAGSGTAGLAVAHFGSNNMIALRYRLRSARVRIAEKSFSAEGIEFPPGSFVIVPPADLNAARAAIEQLGLTAASLSALPAVAMHEADPPRIAMYSSWNGTQEIGWVRYTFDRFGIPYDLIYKERLTKGNLRADYDVIVMPTQTATRQAIFQPPAARPVPYVKDAKYKFLGMYGESPDITGGMGGQGVDAFAKFLDGGGTLIAMGDAVRFPADLGLARTVDASGSTSRDFYAPRPIVNAEVLRLDHPVFYGYTERIMPVKYLGGPLMSVGAPDQSAVLARYVGGDAAVLSGLMKGADEIRQRPFAIDVPGGYSGKGRVVLFANNPVYRWQNHGEFNMVFNALLNWNDLATMPKPAPTPPTAADPR